jgi:small subunit ribosomal protein S6
MDSLSGCDIRVQEPRGGITLNRYEVVFITHSDLSKDEIEGLIDRYKLITSNFKGMVVKVEKWGIRKLAYPIAKQTKGMYCLMDYVGNAAVVNEVERNFKFDDKVLKFQTIKKAESVDLNEIEKEMSGAKEEKAEEVKPEAAPAPIEAPAETQESTEEVKIEAAALSESGENDGEGEKE